MISPLKRSMDLILPVDNVFIWNCSFLFEGNNSLKGNKICLGTKKPSAYADGF
jgi:hypothetical protein